MGCVLQALAECIASRLAVAWCCAGAVGVVVCAMQWQEHLQDIFSWYANFGRTAAQSRAETMDSFMFMKFAKECPGLLQGGYVAGLVLWVGAVPPTFPVASPTCPPQRHTNGGGPHLHQGQAQGRAPPGVPVFPGCSVCAVGEALP